MAETGYNLLFDDGIWSPNGTGLSDAAQQVQGPRLGEAMTSVLALVNSRDTTTPADVSQLLGIDIDTAGRYLRRLADYGLITRTGGALLTKLAVRLSVSRNCAGQALKANGR